MGIILSERYTEVIISDDLLLPDDDAGNRRQRPADRRTQPVPLKTAICAAVGRPQLEGGLKTVAGTAENRSRPVPEDQ